MTRDISVFGPAFRIARREMRSGLKGFRIFVACLLLGVAAIAGVGSLSEAMLQGLRDDGRAILGGEIDVRLIHQQATEEQFAWLEENSARLSQIHDMRAMARSHPGEEHGSRTLVEVKAVDEAYPLYGRVGVTPEQPLQETLERRDGRWGALVHPSLVDRLNLSTGDTLRVGDLDYTVRGTITREPDRPARAFTLGPRVMVGHASISESGLMEPGSLTYHHYRLDLPPGMDSDTWRAEMNAAFPDAGWRARDLDNAAPGIVRFVDQVTLFMTLVGLTALLVGGVGVANAIRSYLDSKQRTIATLKCLGAPATLVFSAYLMQVLTIALLGIGLGVALGAAVPLLVGPVLVEALGFDLAFGIYPRPLLIAALFGLLTTLAFTLWPLARAQAIPAAALFRDVVAHQSARIPAWAWVGIAASALALGALAVFTSDDRQFALGFVVGSVAALLVFRLAAGAIILLSRGVPRSRRPGLRLAISNLHRPGAPTGSVVMSLGLGLTVLVAIALIEGNITKKVFEEMPEEAPGFYFIDIQPDQIESFTTMVRNFEGVTQVRHVPMMRGRITRVEGTRVEELQIPDDVSWVFQGDRGITWSGEAPENANVVRGDWWPEDYEGPQLVSLDRRVADAMGLGLGDSLTVNVLGRNIEAEIGNLRAVEWSDLQINFVMVFSPGVLSDAPQSFIATVHSDPERESALEDAVNAEFPNVSAIQVKEVLGQVSEVLSNIATAVRSTASVTVLAGTLVLAGAVAAGQRRRIYDAVVLKVLGATRRNVTNAFLLEYGLLGAVTGLLAAAIGTLAAWVVVTYLMEGGFVFLPGSVALTVIVAATVTVLFGYAGTFRALRQKAAPLLRNE